MQAVQAPNADTAQCTGHGPWSQAWVSAVCGHAAPPKRGATLARLRFCEPAPHDLVQVDHGPNASGLQLTGHACVLQLRVSAVCGQALPPFLGAVLERLRDWKPLGITVTSSPGLNTPPATRPAYPRKSCHSSLCGRMTHCTGHRASTWLCSLPMYIVSSV